MGLENFIADNTEAEDEIDEDGIDDNILHLIKQLQNIGNVNESPAHYNTKIKAAISLAKEGYTVYIDHQFDSKTSQRADIYATWPSSLNSGKENDDIEYKTLIVEIGECNASRAKNAIDYADCIILVPKGESLDDSLIITEEDVVSSQNSEVPEILTDKLESSMYINIDGVPFTPTTHDIYVERYKELAAIMIDSLTDVSDMSKKNLVEEVNNYSNGEYSHNDILKVADEVGFI